MEQPIGSTVRVVIADQVSCAVCGKQVYAEKTPYVCHDCWKNGKVGEFIAAKDAEATRLREALQKIANAQLRNNTYEACLVFADLMRGCARAALEPQS